MLRKPCLGLLRQADELRHRNPKQAVKVAEGARDLAARIDDETVGRREWLALQVEAWSTLGSAYRAVVDLRRAESAFNVALAFLDASESHDGADPLVRPRLAQRASYLRCDQGRFDEALELNEDAMKTYRDLKAIQPLARALVDRALILGRSARITKAVAHLIRAFYLLDPHESPRSFLAAVHNMTIYLCDVAETDEEHREAYRWLTLAACQHARMPEDVNLLKLLMLEGSMAIRRGAEKEGLGKLWAAHNGFERLGSVHNQVVVLLHLAGVFLARGEMRDVKRITGRLFPIFRKLEVDRETSTALMLFYKAAQTEGATLELLDRVMRRVGEVGSTVQIQSG